MGSEWTINSDYAEASRFKSYHKKHPRESAACFENLNSVGLALEEFGRPGAFQLGFFRHEGGNVWRIGQTNVRHARETRLYVYLLVDGKTVYVLTIGDKSQQKRDIQRCRVLAEEIRKKAQP